MLCKSEHSFQIWHHRLQSCYILWCVIFSPFFIDIFQIWINFDPFKPIRPIKSRRLITAVSLIVAKVSLKFNFRLIWINFKLLKEELIRSFSIRGWKDIKIRNGFYTQKILIENYFSSIWYGTRFLMTILYDIKHRIFWTRGRRSADSLDITVRLLFWSHSCWRFIKFCPVIGQVSATKNTSLKYRRFLIWQLSNKLKILKFKRLSYFFSIKNFQILRLWIFQFWIFPQF